MNLAKFLAFDVPLHLGFFDLSMDAGGNPRGNRYGLFFLIHSAMLSWFGIAESCADMICA